MLNIDKITNFIKPLSNILFLDSGIVALIILLVILISPNMMVSGLICVLITYMYIKLLNSENISVDNVFVYNSMLIGMGIGYIFPLSLKSIVLISISSAICIACTVILSRIFRTYKLPVLSLPFAIVSIIIYIASAKYSIHNNILLETATSYDITLPLVISGFLKSLGGIFFLPVNIVGIALIILILIMSPIMFVMTIVGYYLGIFVSSLFIGSIHLALYDVYAFNYILVSASLCGVFLIASTRSFIISIIAVSMTVIIKDSLTVLLYSYHVPIFTLPFNIVVISILFVLSIIYYSDINYSIKSTPEKSLLDYWNAKIRFANLDPKISLPFSGEWDVYQCFDDDWTHKGDYKYAYYFVKRKNGKSYISDKNILENYISYGESILSPICGYVVDCRHDLIDNCIGNVDIINNWVTI